MQQPQTPCSQPTWVPVAPSEWRRKSESSVRGVRLEVVGVAAVADEQPVVLPALDALAEHARRHGSSSAAARTALTIPT